MVKRNIVHIDIPVVDAAKAGQFFNNLFGWQIQPFPEFNCATWEVKDGSRGGFNSLGPDTKPGDVLIYVDSEDIDADLKHAAKLGATIVQPKKEIPGIGWYGYFKDPTGNTIGLYAKLHSHE